MIASLEIKTYNIHELYSLKCLKAKTASHKIGHYGRDEASSRQSLRFVSGYILRCGVCGQTQNATGFPLLHKETFMKAIEQKWCHGFV